MTNQQLLEPTTTEYQCPFPIQYKKSFTYAKRVPTLIYTNTSGKNKLVRWVLDLNEIKRIEKAYPPVISDAKTTAIIGKQNQYNVPVFIQTDRLLYGPESILQDFDLYISQEKQLFPSEKTARKEVLNYYNLFVSQLNTAVEQYQFSELFSSKKNTLTLLKKQVSFFSRLRYTFMYSGYKKRIAKQLHIDNEAPIVYLTEIENIFTQVSNALSDGRPYLVNNKLSAADLAFAAIAAPIILPEEFGGAQTKFNEVSEEFRLQIMKLRATPAGQFVMKLYQEQRPINLNLGPLPAEPSFFKKILNTLITKLSSNQSSLFYFLQKYFPVLKLGIAKVALVTKHSLVVDVLNRDEDFTIKEINAKKMANQKGTFFLGMDRNNPQFNRERNFVRKATHKDDLDRIRTAVREHANTICKQVQSFEKLDVVQTLNYNVLLGILDTYFGVPAPVKSQMKKWQRTMFYDLFLNFTNNAEKHEAAVNSGKERTTWVLQLIHKSNQNLAQGNLLEDTILNRLILLQQEEENTWVDNDVIRRNIGGLLTGLQETTSKAVIYSLQELFKRPKQLKGAIEAAKNYDMDLVKGYVYEALRFNPVQPGVLRFSETKQILKGAGKKTYTIPGNTTVMPLTSAAMFDPVVFPNPKEFNPNRDARYMNWGFGLHECYGKYINSVTIPELVAAVLRLPNVKNAKGSTGKGSGLTIGPFPNNYIVTFSQETQNT